MSRIKCVLVMFLALAVSGGGHLLSAQQGLGGGGLGLYGVGPRLGENVALALEFQDQLGLSQDQVASLQLLQDGIRQDVEPLETEMAGLRAGIQAGEVNSVDGLATLQELFGEFQTVSAPYRAQVDAVLSPVQHQTLQGIMWESRPIQGQGFGTSGQGMGWNSGLAPGLGSGQSMRPGRGAGMGLGRSAGIGLGRGGGVGLGRGLGGGVGLRRGVAGRRVYGRGLRWRY